MLLKSGFRDVACKGPNGGLKVLLWLLFCLFLLAQPHAGYAQETAPTNGETKTTITVETDVVADLAIERRILNIFEEINHLRRVQVSVDAGVVRLRGTVLTAEAIEEAATLAARVEGVVTVKNQLAQATSLRERLTPAWNRFLDRLAQMIALAPLIAVAAVAFLIFVGAGWLLARLSWPWDAMAPNGFVADLYRQIVKISFGAAGLVVALDLLGATALLGTMLGAAGIVGLAVGFAVRDTVENYIASIMLSVRQPFRPNDHVAIDAFEGYVIRLTARATILLTFDGNHVRIPNSNVFKGVITNYTLNPERRFSFSLGVNADCNLREALDLVLETLKGFDFTLDDPEPSGWIADIGDSNVALSFSGWVDQRKTSFTKARSESIRLTKRALEAAGFSLPEPAFRLNIHGDAALPAGVPAQTRPDHPEPIQPPREDAHVGDASAEVAVVERVEEERARSGQEDDLLSSEAPQE